MIQKYLYSRDSKGKVRVLIITIKELTTVETDLTRSGTYAYTISRASGLLDGKLIQQPTISIVKGLAGRTLKEQCELKVTSIINSQRDKGYKLLSELTSGDVDPNDYEVIDGLLPTLKTYVNGSQKLMLAKDPKPGTKYFKRGLATLWWAKKWWISRKLDGIRAAVFVNKGEFKAISRTGKSLDVAFTNIFRNIDLLKVSQVLGEDKMIDGELYIHGRRLQTLAGIAALKEYDPLRHDDLEFWIFDYADDTTTAEERAKKLNALAALLKGTNVKINIQTPVTSYDEAKLYHDAVVQKGYEGAILRDATGLYGYGKRDDRMIKLKEFQDAEFQITGYKLGLRGAEDMCFTCVTEDGKPFEAKPIGDKQTKLGYVADFDNIKGKMLTVKFFNYSADDIPILPAGVCVRDYE